MVSRPSYDLFYEAAETRGLTTQRLPGNHYLLLTLSLDPRSLSGKTSMVGSVTGKIKHGIYVIMFLTHVALECLYSNCIL